MQHRKWLLWSVSHLVTPWRGFRVSQGGRERALHGGGADFDFEPPSPADLASVLLFPLSVTLGSLLTSLRSHRRINHVRVPAFDHFYPTKWQFHVAPPNLNTLKMSS